jgi:AAA domain
MTKQLPPYIERVGKPDISWARKANGKHAAWMDDRYKGQWEGDPDETPAQGWLVKGVIPKLGVGLIAGQTGMGKTFAVLDLVQCLILERDFANHRVECPGGVMLFAAEAPSQVRRRWEGLRKAKIAPWFAEQGEDVKRMPFKWVTNCPRLTADNAYDEMLLFCQRMQHECKEQYDCDLVLIAVDTLSAAADFRDQNDAGEAQRIMNLLARLTEATGATVVVVDHFGKDENRGVRGSSAKEAAADFVLSVLGEKSQTGVLRNLRLAIRKMRGGAAGDEIPFRLTPVDMGADLDGEPVRELTVQWENEGAVRTGRPNGAVRPLLDALDDALIDAGRMMAPGPGYPIVRVVEDSLVREIFRRKYPSTGDPDKREAAIKKAWERVNKHREARRCVGTYAIDNGVVLMWRVQVLPTPSASVTAAPARESPF